MPKIPKREASPLDTLRAIVIGLKLDLQDERIRTNQLAKYVEELQKKVEHLERTQYVPPRTGHGY